MIRSCYSGSEKYLNIYRRFLWTYIKHFEILSAPQWDTTIMIILVKLETNWKMLLRLFHEYKWNIILNANRK